jgi:lipopolysaccharide transport system permease protein
LSVQHERSEVLAERRTVTPSLHLAPEPPAESTRGGEVTVNEPPSRVPLPDLHEIARSKELLYYLTWRDVKVRYKQTAIGAGWAVLQPVLAMLIFTLVFGRLAKIDSSGIPYSVFAYAALVPWTFFSTALTQAAGSLLQNERLITKVYFPRLIIPLASVAGVLVDLGLASIVLIGLMLVFGIAPSIGLLLVPVFVLMAAIAAVGVGSMLAAMNVRYRDIRYVIPFLVQLWLFVSPVAYATKLVPSQWRLVYALNPMVGVIGGFRWAFLGTPVPVGQLLVSGGASIVILFFGLYVFRRFEDTFADEI